MQRQGMQQDYLTRAADALRSEILPAAPPSLLVTYGYPSKGASGLRRKIVGECHGGKLAPVDYSAAIFISPAVWGDSCCWKRR